MRSGITSIFFNKIEHNCHSMLFMYVFGCLLGCLFLSHPSLAGAQKANQIGLSESQLNLDDEFYLDSNSTYETPLLSMEDPENPRSDSKIYTPIVPISKRLMEFQPHSFPRIKEDPKAYQSLLDSLRPGDIVIVYSPKNRNYTKTIISSGQYYLHFLASMFSRISKKTLPDAHDMVHAAIYVGNEKLVEVGGNHALDEISLIPFLDKAPNAFYFVYRPKDERVAFGTTLFSMALRKSVEHVSYSSRKAMFTLFSLHTFNRKSVLSCLKYGAMVKTMVDSYNAEPLAMLTGTTKSYFCSEFVGTALLAGDCYRLLTEMEEKSELEEAEMRIFGHKGPNEPLSLNYMEYTQWASAFLNARGKDLKQKIRVRLKPRALSPQALIKYLEINDNGTGYFDRVLAIVPEDVDSN